GKRPFKSRDRSGNVWWLAVLSCGESWHNLHHADPTSARHGVERGQLDSSARLIRFFELAGWAYDVRWPSRSRIDSRRNTAEGGSRRGEEPAEAACWSLWRPTRTLPATTSRGGRAAPG